MLHICPSQRKALLTSLRVVDPNGSSVVGFETYDVQPHFPYHVDFQVHVECLNKAIKRTIIDKGVATSMMSLAC